MQVHNVAYSNGFLKTYLACIWHFKLQSGTTKKRGGKAGGMGGRLKLGGDHVVAEPLAEIVFRDVGIETDVAIQLRQRLYAGEDWP